MARVHSLGLSDIGRGLALSTYVLPTVLYHAEFEGISPPFSTLATRLARSVAPGVPPALLTGRPADGGFGVLPFVAHITARHAAMACRLAHRFLQPSATWPAWVHLAACILRSACPSLHPVQSLLAATLAPAALVQRGDLQLPSGLQLQCLPQGALSLMTVALQRVGPLQPVDPLSPVASITLHTPHASLPGAAAPVATELLCWRSTTSRPLRPTTGRVTVRALTTMLNAPAVSQRVAAHLSFTTAALGEPASPAHQRAFTEALCALWRTPCTNALKVPMWRLAVDAIPGAHVRPWHCPCDLHRVVDGPSRLHSFWHCPVAQGVRTQLQSALGMPLLPRAAVWLLAPPHPGIHPGVWRLVACLAVEAMEYGRRVLWARRHSADWPAPGLAGLQARVTLLAAVSNLAAARFWHHLHDFASGYATSLPGQFHHPPLPMDHPFLAAHGSGLRALLPPEFLEAP